MSPAWRGPTPARWNRVAGGPPGLRLDLVTHLHRQVAFSLAAFGPGDRQAGVLDHMRKEMVEVEESGGSLDEWTDLVILALDGAWRCGATPEQVAAALIAKQTRNEQRTWPDWRTAPEGKAIEHDRTKDGDLIPVKLPADWERIEGIKVLDRDGWRTGVNGWPATRRWGEPITSAEFLARANQSTIDRLTKDTP